MKYQYWINVLLRPLVALGQICLPTGVTYTSAVRGAEVKAVDIRSRFQDHGQRRYFGKRPQRGPVRTIKKTNMKHSILKNNSS